ncbi:MAG: DUF998 domain-containing protein [Anaerolineales bacterium]
MSRNLEKERQMVYSYMTLRKAIGILGIAMPFIVALGAMLIFHTGLQSSISGYYHTGMRDVFVGILFSLGVFLLSYRGYGREDDLAGNLACIFAIGIALFPTTPEDRALDVIGYVHLGFAAAFFLTLTYFSLVLFTKTNPVKPPTRRKLQRNRVYRVCGYIMLACIALLMVYHMLPADTVTALKRFSPVFWLEALAILAFGFSWFTKGEAILKDELDG